MWLYQDTIRHSELGTDILHLEVLLDGQHLNQWTGISISCAKIWDILHQYTVHDLAPNGWTTSFYYDFASMRMLPLNQSLPIAGQQ